jgi:hypothetical protein
MRFTLPFIISHARPTEPKVVFVCDYNMSRLYNPTNFELSVSFKKFGLYNLDGL